MAEISRFWTTDGTGDGPSAGYTATQFADFLIGTMGEGVLTGVDNELECTGTSSPVAVATGAALCAGRYYENTASENVAITTPLLGTTGFRIVLEADWTAQTVRITLSMNSDGNSNPPALVQSEGSQWQTSLCTGTIDTGGNIVVTDARVWASYSTQIQDGTVTTSKLAPDAVTSAKIADSAVGTDQLASQAVTGGKIANLTITGGNIAYKAITNTEIADLTILAGRIADYNIPRAKLGAGAPRLAARQGGSSSSFNTPGSTTYKFTSISPEALIGSMSGTVLDGQNYTTVTATFPYGGYVNNPLAYITCVGWTVIANIYLVSTTQLSVRVHRNYYYQTSNQGFVIYWMTIGDEFNSPPS